MSVAIASGPGSVIPGVNSHDVAGTSSSAISPLGVHPLSQSLTSTTTTRVNRQTKPRKKAKAKPKTKRRPKKTLLKARRKQKAKPKKGSKPRKTKTWF